MQKLEFENKEIDIQELPKIEDLQFNKIEKSYMFILLWRILLPAFIINGIGLFFYFTGKTNIPANAIFYALTGLNFLILIRILIVLISFKVRAYALRDRDITYQRGLLVFKQTTVSVNRIQHIELTQSVLMKWLNLTTMKIYTAGGSQSDISISGIKKEKGEEIKELLTKKLSQHE